MQGDVSAVRALLQQGAEPNAKDNAGWTPLVCLTLLLYTYACTIIFIRIVAVATINFSLAGVWLLIEGSF